MSGGWTRRSALASLTPTMGLGVVLGVAGGLTPLPGGALIGAMLGAALGGQVAPTRVPDAVGTAGRFLVGVAAGGVLALERLGGLGSVALWGAIGSVLVVAVGAAAGALVARRAGIDRGSAVVAMAPGGMAELTSIANEFDLRSDVIVAVHLVRRVGLVLAVGAALVVLA